MLSVKDNTVEISSTEKEHAVPKTLAQRVLHEWGHLCYKFCICNNLLAGEFEQRNDFFEWFTNNSSSIQISRLFCI